MGGKCGVDGRFFQFVRDSVKIGGVVSNRRRRVLGFAARAVARLPVRGPGFRILLRLLRLGSVCVLFRLATAAAGSFGDGSRGIRRRGGRKPIGAIAVFATAKTACRRHQGGKQDHGRHEEA